MLYQPENIPSEALAVLLAAEKHSCAETAEEWLDNCRQDDAQLWRDGDCWMVTEVRDTRSGRMLRIVALSGEPYSPGLVREAEEWGRSVGCVRAFFEGRKGWERLAPDYKVRAVISEKEL